MATVGFKGLKGRRGGLYVLKFLMVTLLLEASTYRQLTSGTPSP